MYVGCFSHGKRRTTPQRIASGVEFTIAGWMHGHNSIDGCRKNFRSYCKICTHSARPIMENEESNLFKCKANAVQNVCLNGAKILVGKQNLQAGGAR
jgi:hypothetical protein